MPSLGYWFKIELVSFDVAVEHISHNVTRSIRWYNTLNGITENKHGKRIWCQLIHKSLLLSPESIKITHSILALNQVWSKLQTANPAWQSVPFSCSERRIKWPTWLRLKKKTNQKIHNMENATEMTIYFKQEVVYDLHQRIIQDEGSSLYWKRLPSIHYPGALYTKKRKCSIHSLFLICMYLPNSLHEQF